ncbi:hypothetical protein HanIR_Chr05g0230371 [Helianthus annuus]|nr:hypothetical protein HanIR_Chr05g0230371 [Helianthus annuus]
MDQVVTLYLTQNLLGLSLPMTLHTYHWLCSLMETNGSGTVCTYFQAAFE